MATGDQAKFLGLMDARKAHEPGQVVPIGAPGLGAGEVGKPLGLGRHLGQAGKFGRGEGAEERRAERLEVGDHGGHVNH